MPALLSWKSRELRNALSVSSKLNRTKRMGRQNSELLKGKEKLIERSLNLNNLASFSKVV
jgi:hypothetical protein